MPDFELIPGQMDVFEVIDLAQNDPPVSSGQHVDPDTGMTEAQMDKFVAGIEALSLAAFTPAPPVDDKPLTVREAVMHKLGFRPVDQGDHDETEEGQ